MKTEYKLLIGGGALIIITALVGGMIIFNTLTDTTNNLSGQIVELEDNPMPGFPCHEMGGQYMGDCTVREIELEAYQYDWSKPTIIVRSEEIIRIVATSRDVAHGLAIPEINFDMHIQPGQTTREEFQAPQPGEYQFGCSVSCGPGHHEHTGKLLVIE